MIQTVKSITGLIWICLIIVLPTRLLLQSLGILLWPTLPILKSIQSVEPILIPLLFIVILGLFVTYIFIKYTFIKNNWITDLFTENAIDGPIIDTIPLAFSLLWFSIVIISGENTKYDIMIFGIILWSLIDFDKL